LVDDCVVTMQAWADYLDRLKAGGEVIQFQRVG
jgi:hypothetical protein